jgi:hypothetical protein
MWVITVFLNGECAGMYEFDTEQEARESLKNIQGYKILTEMITSPEPSSLLVAI